VCSGSVGEKGSGVPGPDPVKGVDSEGGQGFVAEETEVDSVTGTDLDLAKARERGRVKGMAPDSERNPSYHLRQS
jgi:hypothetical protein